MLAKPGELPEGAGWSYEFKWDGYRTLLLADKGKARLASRNLLDVTANYPELQAVAAFLEGHRAILDGEVAVLDARGRPDFGALQQRTGFGPTRADGPPQPVVFLAFDLLWLDGTSLMDQPFAARRGALEEFAGDAKAEGGWWVPPASAEGEVMLQASQALGLEGIVAKRLDARYEPGKRTGAWVKVKNVHRQEFVIGGYTPGEGGRRGYLGALQLGCYDEAGDLLYVGGVGTGFTDAELQRLRSTLASLGPSQDPFKPNPLIPRATVFVPPRLVCEVKFSGFTHDGQVRHGSYLGLRTDKDPKDVHKEDV